MEIQKTLSTRSTTKGNGASKTAFYKTRTGKCQRPSGTLHRNPYLNFLREFRLRNTGLSAVEIIRRGAREWKSMPKEEKLQYIEEAFYAPKKRKPPAPPPIPAQPTQMRATPFQDSCGIVCPNPCARKRRRRKSKCARRRRPKRRRCAKKRRKRRGCKRKRRRSCRI
ncbi:protamine-like protein 99C isoform X1 [Zeugodacus cucurbitae]|uniref:Protamine n=1 Tax=Zeugodacus cucurbitae TaxID=28588 RepID=A0A0A1WNR9_ZEUCU|nr:protamine-like protein 99C isoform X1 [Zeugodacus cucurbitae]XP_011181365.1 protamine-like protein 99C isoform X1 [Zeugodacus cucurbitae]